MRLGDIGAWRCRYFVASVLGVLLFFSPASLLALNITLSWSNPASYTDGTPVPDLAGNRVYIGTMSGLYTRAIDTGRATSCEIDLQGGTTYYLAVTVYDGSGNESGFSNEVSIYIPVGSDLRVRHVNIPRRSRKIGSRFTVRETVVNLGGATAGSSLMHYYLSEDRVKDGNDIRLRGNRLVPGLKSGRMSTARTEVIVPAGTRAGRYYVLACSDDRSRISEDNEKNNCTPSGRRIRIGR